MNLTKALRSDNAEIENDLSLMKKEDVNGSKKNWRWGSRKQLNCGNGSRVNWQLEFKPYLQTPRVELRQLK